MRDGKVHLVDDDDAVRDSIGFLLESSGFSLQSYADPTAVLEALKGCAGLVMLNSVGGRGLSEDVLVFIFTRRSDNTFKAEGGTAVAALLSSLNSLTSFEFRSCQLGCLPR